jgi:hypothetical protein
MPQNLYWGFLNDSSSWHDLFLQTMPDPPWWAGGGLVAAIQGQYVSLQSNVASSGNSTAAKTEIWSYVADVSGYGLAGLDFFTAGSLSALKLYIDTRDPYVALCATFPGQMAQLLANSFDPNISIDDRAQYFGELLSISALTTVLAGHDQFDFKFQAALKDAGLLDSWSTVKPLPADIATTVSSKAVALTLAIAEKVSRNFPTDSWAPPYAVFRIDSMADVLRDAGFTPDSTEQKIQGLAQVADSSGDPGGVGDSADGVSYDDGGAIRVVVTGENRAYLYSDAQTMRQIKASFLQDNVAGFTAGQTIFLKVYYWEAKTTVYHLYTGGDYWNPTVPAGIGKPGDVLTISVQVLTRDDFIKSLPPMYFVNKQGVAWVADTSQISDYTLVGDQLTLHLEQDPPIESDSYFTITGQLSDSLGFGSTSGTYVDLHITDIFADDQTLRIYYEGYGPVALGLSQGTIFTDVYLISYDGVRLRIVYGIQNLATSTYYPEYDPSVLYRLSSMNSFSLPYPGVTGYSESFLIDNVATTRIIDNAIVYHGSPNDLARVGAEIAYTVATEKLGLTDVVMEDPAEGGSDLYTPNHNVVIEARMLYRTIGESGPDLTADVTKQLNQMIGRLQSDFSYYKTATVGYAVLTYVVDQNTIRTIVLEVLPP